MILSCNIFQEDSKGKPLTRLLRQKDKKPRNPQSSPIVKSTFELPPFLVGMKTQNPGNYRPIKEMFMACFVSSGNLLPARCLRLMSGYQASKCITKYSIENFFVCMWKQWHFRKNQTIEATTLKISNRLNRERLGNFCS